MTKDGIEYNLNITPYKVDVCYTGVIITYKFSSEMYKNKFINQSVKNREKNVNENFKLNMEIVRDIKSYNNIEKRGFEILKNGIMPFYSKDEITLTSIYDIV